MIETARLRCRAYAVLTFLLLFWGLVRLAYGQTVEVSSTTFTASVTVSSATPCGYPAESKCADE